MLTNATEPTAIPAATRSGLSTSGTPYTGAATARSTTPAIAIAVSPIASCASAKDQRGKPEAANRRSTPRSRYDAMWTGSMIRPVAPMTTVK